MNVNFNSIYAYTVGGSLSVDDPTYVKREADDKLFEGLKAGKFCYVLNSRQMGKSSLRVRTMARLRAEDVACTSIDVSTFGKETTADEFYGSFVNSLRRDFNLSIDINAWWHDRDHLLPVQRLKEFIEEELLTHVPQNIVIFIEEIDSLLRLSFKDEFFAFIRVCYEERGAKPNYDRLTFTLLGVATPNALIEDKNKTPFNIGIAIELNGFSMNEVMPLVPGLAEVKVVKPALALQKVLNWTGGQPFLTQKLCKIIQTSGTRISEDSEFGWINTLVRSEVISDWQSKDEPQHLKTISYRIIKSNINTTGRLLYLYQQILEQKQIAADDSPGEIELRLSGLVVKESNYLRVYNLIYEEVFDLNWVSKELKKVRPYTEPLKAWQDSNRDNSHLLRGEEIDKALKWSEGKSLGDLDYQFLSASQELDREQEQKDKQVAQEMTSSEQTRAKRWRLATVAAAVTIFTGTGGFLQWKKFSYCPDNQVRLDSVCLIVASSGESILFHDESNFDLKNGVKAFKSGNYYQARDFFKKAVASAPNKPEPQIYLNNAKARLKSSPFTLAVAVPVDNRASRAEEILRGVADAQTKFNDAGGLNGRLLEIIIANDGGDKNVASKVAQELADNSDVLGVVGHNSSDASRTALAEYEKAELAMVTSTSTSTSLRSPVFFRTVPSDSAAGAKLANYAKSKGLDKVAIYFDPQSDYSSSLLKAFEEKFTYHLGGSTVHADLTDSDLDAKTEIQRRVNEEQVQAAILLPSINTTSVAISIATANAELPPGQRLQLLGGDALYSPYTLTQGGAAVEDLILIVPWSDETPNAKTFVQAASNRWKGRVSWATAASYDATQALIDALSRSSNATRKTVLDNLKTVNLLANETSGYELRFSEGERSGEPRLVQVVKGAPSPSGSQYGFKLLE